MEPTPIRYEARPIVQIVIGGMIVGWRIWLEIVHYSDGSKTEVYRQSHEPTGY